MGIIESIEVLHFVEPMCVGAFRLNLQAAAGASVANAWSICGAHIKSAIVALSLRSMRLPIRFLAAEKLLPERRLLRSQLLLHFAHLQL